MKKILALTGLVSLLGTTGCLVLDGRRHGRARYDDHPEGIQPPPPVVVSPPTVVERSPEILGP